MPFHDDLFALSADLDMRFEIVGGVVPVLLVDNVYARPDDVREQVLTLPFEPAPLHYPGRIAAPPDGNPSVERMVDWARQLANGAYLSFAEVPWRGGVVAGFREVRTDFAVVDVHPADLTQPQRLPHVDPVPLFGLVYLSREERGGTLFFERVSNSEQEPGQGYFAGGGAAFDLLGRIEPRFNRLAIYPGSVPHTGEIAGEWIESEARFTRPRLTQRLLFAP